MFVLTEIKDVARVMPSHFSEDRLMRVELEINKKYANKVCILYASTQPTSCTSSPTSCTTHVAMVSPAVNPPWPGMARWLSVVWPKCSLMILTSRIRPRVTCIVFCCMMLVQRLVQRTARLRNVECTWPTCLERHRDFSALVFVYISLSTSATTPPSDQRL